MYLLFCFQLVPQGEWELQNNYLHGMVLHLLNIKFKHPKTGQKVYVVLGANASEILPFVRPYM